MLEVLSCVAVWIPRRWTLVWLCVMVFLSTVGLLRQSLARVPRGWQSREAWGAYAGSIRLVVSQGGQATLCLRLALVCWLWLLLRSPRVVSFAVMVAR